MFADNFFKGNSDKLVNLFQFCNCHICWYQSFFSSINKIKNWALEGHKNMISQDKL